MALELRQYQKDAANSLYLHWRNFKRLLTVMPTGTGKTIVFCKVAEYEAKRGRRVCILAHREELLSQAQDKLRAATGMDSALERAESSAIGDPRMITVASVNSMSQKRRLEQYSKSYFDLLIIDEGHRILSPSYMRILEHFDGARVASYTATPGRSDKKSLAKVFECISYQLSMKDAIRDGWIVPIMAQTIPVDVDLSAAKKHHGDIAVEDADTAIAPYLDELARLTHKFASDRKCLAFLPLCRTSASFAEKLTAAGMHCKHIQGNSKDRKEILAWYEEMGNGYVLSNAQLLSEGWDHPPVSSVEFYKPTEQKHVFMQAIGRGTRPYPGKECLQVLDPIWSSEKFDVATSASLVAESDEEEEKIKARVSAGGPVDLMEAQEEAHAEVTNEREAKLAKYIDEHKHRKGGLIDIEQFGLWCHDEALLGYGLGDEAVFDWQKAPASPDQVKRLAWHKLPSQGLTRGYADALLGTLDRNKEAGKPTPKQMRTIARSGYEPSDYTFETASRLITKLAKNWKRS